MGSDGRVGTAPNVTPGFTGGPVAFGVPPPLPPGITMTGGRITGYSREPAQPPTQPSPQPVTSTSPGLKSAVLYNDFR